MDFQNLMHLLANIVLLLHFLYISFVVLGFLLILVGGYYGWNWTRNVKFRILHLMSIGFVVAESWLNIECPLTTLENWFRYKAGRDAYDLDFMAYWLRKIIFYDLPPYFFMIIYSLFGLLVIFAWWKFPPRK